MIVSGKIINQQGNPYVGLYVSLTDEAVNMVVGSMTVGTTGEYSFSGLSCSRILRLDVKDSPAGNILFTNTFHFYCKINDVCAETEYKDLDIKIYNSLLGGNDLLAGYYKIVRECSDSVCFYNTQSSNYTNIYWKLDDSNIIGEGDKFCVSLGAGSRRIAQAVTKEENSCRQSLIWNTWDNIEPLCPPIIYKENSAFYYESVQLDNYKPEVSFTASNISNCCNGVVKDCVPLNEEIVFKPTISFNNALCCTGTNQVTWYVKNPNSLITSIVAAPSSYELNHIFNILGEWEVSLEVVNCCSTCTYSKKILVGNNVSITRIDCKKWKITDSYSYDYNNLTARISIHDLNNKLIDSKAFDGYSGNKSIEIGIEKDGVHVIQYQVYGYDNNGDTVILIDRDFVVYDFCGLLACYKKMIEENLCYNCCKDCETDADRIVKMDTLNKFMLLQNSFMAAIGLYAGITNNKFYLDTKYISVLKDSDAIIGSMYELCYGCNNGSVKLSIK